MYKNRLKAYKDMGYEVEFHAQSTTHHLENSLR